MNTVLESTTRHAVDTIHVTFARIYTPEETGGLKCRAAFPARNLVYPLGIGLDAPPAASVFYAQALRNHNPKIISRNDPGLTEEDRRSLMLDVVNSICLCPLWVGDEPLGLLILGEARSAIREPFDSDKLRLVSAIADQAASALQRANLHEQMEASFVQTVVALANAAEERDSVYPGAQ